MPTTSPGSSASARCATQLGVPVVATARQRGPASCEPALAPSVRAALDVPGDHASTRARLSPRCARPAPRPGVTMRPGEQVEQPRRGAASTLAGGARIEAGRVVVATGPWSGRAGAAAEGPDPATARPRRPRAARTRAALPADGRRRTALGRLRRARAADGRYVLGATSEERGFDTAVTAGGVRELLAEAQTVRSRHRRAGARGGRQPACARRRPTTRR